MHTMLFAVLIGVRVQILVCASVDKQCFFLTMEIE